MLLLNVFLAGLACAQISRTITGTVKDSVNNDIEEANVSLIAGKDTLRTVTSRTGKFSFKNVVAERITVHIQSVGYAPQTRAWEIK
ncbi:MAG: carboxypeptidase regulatory-like domain-containing protein, partial [Pedobacter sp.]